jgi:hypothetical protein
MAPGFHACVNTRAEGDRKWNERCTFCRPDLAMPSGRRNFIKGGIDLCPVPESEDYFICF